MSIIVYTKTNCPWSKQVMEYLKRNAVSFEERNMSKHPEYTLEVIEKTGQFRSPTLDINGTMLANVGVEEVAAALTKLGTLQT